VKIIATRFGAAAAAATALAVSIGLGGCNAAGPQVQAAAETACAVVDTAALTRGLKLDNIGEASFDAALAACKASNDGQNLTVQSDTQAVLAAVVMLQPILANLHVKAMPVAESKKIAKMRAFWAKLEREASEAGFSVK
jgi:hypothetical protein